MKAIFVEKIENHIAFDRNKYCPMCGEHQFDIVEQLEPPTEFPWSVRCPACQCETGQYSIKDGAIAAWKTFR